jgi:predicted transposase/invertase (TIGR01784 family)
MRYLDPKNDLTFKRIFGEHPALLMSLLNALLPLEDGNEVTELEYLPSELVPDIPEFKNSIVDVRCTDRTGRQFIVEMQMLWTASFKARVLFNASKAYIRQIAKAKKYSSLQPVYALNILDDIFVSPEKNPHYYHHYSIIHTEDPDEKLEGLEFVFIELPKFVPRNLAQKRMAILWLRFLTEVKDREDADYAELRSSCDELSQALDILKESSFTIGELDHYDRFWDSVRKEKTYADERAELAQKEGFSKGEEIGLAKGEEIGLAKGEEIGKELGKAELTEKMILKCHHKGMTVAEIADLTDVVAEDVLAILRKNGLA